MTGLERENQALKQEIELLARENIKLIQEVRELRLIKQRRENSGKAKFILG